MKRLAKFLVLGVVGILLASGVCRAEVKKVDLSASDVSTRVASSAEVGTYYVFEFPEGALEFEGSLRTAILELSVDVSTRDMGDYEPESVLLQVLRLTESLGADFDEDKVAHPAPSVRALRPGDGQTVQVDVTEIVEYYLENPTKNYGVVVGNLRGSRHGVFVLNSGVIGSGVSARITIISSEQKAEKASLD